MKRLTILAFALCSVILNVIAEEPVIIGSKIVLHSDILQEDREILLYLPGDYESSEKQYPILFHFQGSEVLFHKETGTVKFLSELREDIPPMIFVNILFTDYRRDVFPRKLEGVPGTGGSDNFLDFLELELLPFLNNNFRTTEFYTVYGQSNTGILSLYAQFSRPGLFDACIASSPSVGQGGNFMYELTDSLLMQKKFTGNKLYITHALDDPLTRIVGDALPGYLQILNNKAPAELEWKYVEQETGGHCPQNSLNDGLLWQFSDWKIPETIQKESVKAIISYSEDMYKKYGISPEISGILQDTGFDLIRSEDYDKALDYMRKLTELRPDELLYHYQIGKISAVSGKFSEQGIKALEMYIGNDNENLNPSKSAACWRLGLIYENLGDQDSARDSYEKGLQLDPEDTYCKEALTKLESEK